MRTTVLIIFAALAAVLAAGCGATAITTPHSAARTALPTPPATVPGVQQLGQPFEAIPDVTVTVTAKVVALPAGVTGAVAPGVVVTVAYRNDTAQPLASVAPIQIRISDQNGATANPASIILGEHATSPPVKPLGKVFPGHTGTLITSGIPASPWKPDQPIVVDVPQPVPDGEPANWITTTTVTGVADPK
jgi:hypothetical protein